MNSRLHFGCLLQVLVCLAVVQGPAGAATIQVDDDGEADFRVIQAAVDAASPNDVIVVNPGTYTGTGNRDIDLQGKAITIRGTDPLDSAVVQATVINCEGTEAEPHRGFLVVDCNGAVISGLTVTGGVAAAGGGIFCENSALDLTYCRILNNVTLPGSPESDPNGGPGGGVYAASSEVTLLGCTLGANATGAGGASQSAEETRAGNGGPGAGFYSQDCVVQITDCSIVDNTTGAGGTGEDRLFPAGAGGSGAGVYCAGSGSLTIRTSEIMRNVTGKGGAPSGAGGSGAGICCLPDVTLNMSDSEVGGNVAASGGRGPQDASGLPGESGNGGGILCYSAVIRDTDILENATSTGETAFDGGASGGNGGGLYCPETVRLIGCQVQRNGTGDGGAGSLSGGFGGNGGGVWANTLIATDCTFDDNRTGDGAAREVGRKAGNGGSGAGAFGIRALIERCIITNNRTGDGAPGAEGLPEDGDGGDGAGLYCVSGEIANSLIAGNRTGNGGGPFEAGSGGRGAGIFCGEGTLAVVNCTIADNVTGNDAVSGPEPSSGRGLGGGVYLQGEMGLYNTIIWGNRPDPFRAFGCDDILFCDIEEGVCADIQGNISVAPEFVRAGSWVDANDGTTVVDADDPNALWVPGIYHLRTASPCRDAGDPNYEFDPNEADVTAAPRIVNEAIDIGAYEFQNIVPIYRFWSGKSRKHFYTISEAERAKLIEQYPDVWTSEGIAYYAFRGQSEPNLLPVHRFWSNSLSSHFYTIKESEKNKLVEQFSDVWTYEGPVFYAYPEGQQPAGTMPVYRFWSGRTKAHFYTIKESEKNKLIDQFADVWTYEGIAWYAYEQRPPQELAAQNALAYEFTGGPDSASYEFQLKAYLDGKEAKIDLAEVSLVPEVGRMTMMVDLESMMVALNECHLESAPLEHAATVSVDDAGSVAIPFVLSARGFFDAATPAGADGLDPANPFIPAAAKENPGAGLETFAVIGSVTVDGRKIDVSLEAEATEFDTQGQPVLDTSALPDQLDLHAPPFRWSREQQEDLLLDTTVKGQSLQLYITSVRVQTTGPWQGKRLLDAGK